MKLLGWCRFGLLLAGGGAHAAGFALIEQNGSGLGNAYAGQAAVAEDASAVFFNPAGLTRIAGRQLVLAASAIRPSARFADSASLPAPLQSNLGGDGGDAGDWGGVVNLYCAADLRPGLKFGFGVYAPFGLATDYDAVWAGRFHAVKSEMKTLNINPSLALKLGDGVSVGVGINAQQARAELTNQVNYSALFFQATGGALVVPDIEGTARVNGDDWSWGYNLGLLFEPDEAMRVGVSYRSRLDHRLAGAARFTRPAGLNATQTAMLDAALPDGEVTARARLPDSLSLSLFKQLNPRWDLLADATWTHWSRFEDLTVRRDDGSVLQTTPEHWRDAWRYALGLNYRPAGRMTWRFGVAYDQTPVPDAWRTPRIPDADRIWLALGGQFRASAESAIDFGYAHLFVEDSVIDHASAAGGALVGRYDNAVDILSVQYTTRF